MYGAPVSKSLLESVARTATHSTDAQTNLGHRGLHVIVNVTALADTPSVVTRIQGQDPESGLWYDLLAATAITDVTGTGIYVYKVYPGTGAVVGGAASDFLPATWRLTFTHADADSITYSVGVNLQV